MRFARPEKIRTRCIMLGAAGVTVGLLTLGAGTANALPGEHAKPRNPIELPPPPQMHGLDYMLGTFDCTQPGQTELEVRTVTKRGLGGHYYYSSDTQFQAAPTPDVHALTVYGWNPVDGTFIMQYHDNWGTSGTATSPGWKQGHLRFTGKLLQVLNPNPTGSAKGITLDVTGDRQVVGPGRFTLTHTVTTPDGNSTTGRLDCRRR